MNPGDDLDDNGEDLLTTLMTTGEDLLTTLKKTGADLLPTSDDDTDDHCDDRSCDHTKMYLVIVLINKQTYYVESTTNVTSTLRERTG